MKTFIRDVVQAEKEAMKRGGFLNDGSVARQKWEFIREEQILAEKVQGVFPDFVEIEDLERSNQIRSKKGVL